MGQVRAMECHRTEIAWRGYTGHTLRRTASRPVSVTRLSSILQSIPEGQADERCRTFDRNFGALSLRLERTPIPFGPGDFARSGSNPADPCRVGMGGKSGLSPATARAPVVP